MTQLTKRELIAAEAMQALILANGLTPVWAASYSKMIAAVAVKYADDLIARLEMSPEDNAADDKYFYITESTINCLY